MYKQPILKNSYLLFLFVLLSIQFSCRKLDSRRDIPNRYDAIEISRRFFSVPDQTNETVKRVAKFIQKQNELKGFVGKLVQFDGYPLWDKSLVQIDNYRSKITGESLATTYTDVTSPQSPDTIIYIPLVPSGREYVYSFIWAKQSGNETTWRLFSGRDYDKYPNGTIGSDTITADKIAAISMILDYQAFGHSSFYISDRKLFGNSFKGKNKRTLHISTDKKVEPNQNSSSNSIGSFGYYTVTTTFSFWYNYCPRLANDQSCWTANQCDYELFEHCYNNGECGPVYVFGSSEKMIYIPDGGGGVAGTVSNPPPSGGGSGGDDGIPGNGDSPDDPCQMSSPCGRQGWTPETTIAREVLDNLQMFNATNLVFLQNNPDRAIEILDFLYQFSLPDLTQGEKEDLARKHLQELVNNPEYAQLVEEISSSTPLGFGFLYTIAKDLVLEVGFKILKKYIPGYSDWNSVKDAIRNGTDGNILEMFGDILSLIKKKVPAAALVSAMLDVVDEWPIIKKAWNAIEKIKDIPTNAVNSFLKTVKSKCGSVLDMIEHDNGIQGKLKYNSADAFNFFIDLANDLGVSYSQFSTPHGPGGVFALPGGFTVTFYPVSTTINPATGIGYPTIEFKNGSTTIYKFRFAL